MPTRSRFRTAVRRKARRQVQRDSHRGFSVATASGADDYSHELAFRLMGWTAPLHRSQKCRTTRSRGRSLMKVQILGIDLAKNVFQLHRVDRKGRSGTGTSSPPRAAAEGHWRTGAVPHRHRSFHRRILLATAVREAGSRGEDHGTSVREAIRTPAKERYQRRRGDLHGPAAYGTCGSCRRRRSNSKTSRRCTARASAWSIIERH